MNLKIAVCDDDEKDRDALKSALKNYYIATDIELSVDLYASGRELLTRYQKANDYQIVLIESNIFVLSWNNSEQSVRY